MPEVSEPVPKKRHEKALPCIKCGTWLYQAFPEDVEGGAVETGINQPSWGVSIKCYGNYGSRVIDSFDSEEYVVFSLCDSCLTQAGVEGKVLERRRGEPFRIWDPLEVGRA